MVPGSRIRKYFLYAVGEIFLVVIGILIALQINNWNAKRNLKLKEIQYLEQIRDNLRSDIGSIDHTLEFNVEKKAAIRNAFELFGSVEDLDSLVNGFQNFMRILPNFQLFISTRTAFDNMLNANSIDLIRDNSLRQGLSSYYSGMNTEYSTQGRVVLSNRKFVDDLTPLVMTREFVQETMGADLDIKSNEEVRFHKDDRTLGNLFQLYMTTVSQDSLLVNTRGDIEQLIEQINFYLESIR